MHATIASQSIQERQLDYCLADFFLKNLALEGTLTWGNVRDTRDLLIADLGLTGTTPRAMLPLGGGQSFGVQLLSGLIECESCGYKYEHKTWHAGTKYEKRIWRCNHKYDGEQKCDTPNLNEETAKPAFTTTLQHMITKQTSVTVLDGSNIEMRIYVHLPHTWKLGYQ